MISASELTSRLTIQNPTTTNSDGVSTDTWTTAESNVPASVVPRDSLTFTQAAQVKAETSHVVRMRYRSNVTSKTRFVLGTRTLHVLGLARRVPEDRPTEIIMECLEVE